MFADVWQFHVDSGSQSGPQVGRTGEDVAQVFVPHELVAALLKQGLDLPERERNSWSGVVAPGGSSLPRDVTVLFR